MAISELRRCKNCNKLIPFMYSSGRKLAPTVYNKRIYCSRVCSIQAKPTRINKLGQKLCIQCNQFKDINCFWKAATNQLGVQSKCIECLRLDNRDRYLKSYYVLTLEEFNTLLTTQDNKCSICLSGTPGGSRGQWHVDHDHSCCPGEKSCGQCIRGILCDLCNRGLGYFRDDQKLLEEAIKYLKKKG